jgi:hypothetical protein
MKATMFDVGINDADYQVQPLVGDKRVFCPFYLRWVGMLKRCYSKNYQIKNPHYIGCTVCNEWLTFSNFKKWMEKQDWQGKALDKDIIIVGNKEYSPSACAFVDVYVNGFVTDCLSARGNLPIGVGVCGKTGKLEARCRNPFTKKKEWLGYFEDEQSASAAWRKRKHEISCFLANLQADGRVAAALRLRYTDHIHTRGLTE